MYYFGWILALISVTLLILIYAYGTGKIATPLNSRILKSVKSFFSVSKAVSQVNDLPDDTIDQVQREKIDTSVDSKVVAIRITPDGDQLFNAEKLVLLLRSEGFQHGAHNIFHKLNNGDQEQIRYSIASLVEPGSFDLSNLKESYYPGITIFLVLPSKEDSLTVFDEMLNCAHCLADKLSGKLIDEQGNLLSVQRERFMREEVIDFLHHKLKVTA
ncbi:MAG: cell division protein ZipA C-terminal FtsZ-binding domain-containing protein [Pseudomonadota bacterium]|nr:cell division protein ZipA C-terminal FtsZ-binding domain-containing protein [Pseudomonadota bacterium]